MVYIVPTERFYGSDKSSELEGEVQSALDDMADALISLRYAKTADEAQLKTATEQVDKANAVLYRFGRGFERKA